MADWEPGDDDAITFEYDNRSSRFTPAARGFIQFGDGEPIPTTDISWTFERKPPTTMPLDQFLRRYAGEPELKLPSLGNFEITIPIPPEAASKILRAIGEEGVADRIDVESHPDLAELNAQMDGCSGSQEAT